MNGTALLAAGLALALSGAAPSPGAELTRAAIAAYRGGKSPAPEADPALARAATAVAARVLADGVKVTNDAEYIAVELSRAGGWDPPPRVIAVRAAPPEKAVALISSRTDLASMPATHVGAGFASSKDQGAAVLLFSSRRARLDPFPRAVAVGRSEVLSGELAFPLHDARVYLTGPRGVQRPEAQDTGARNRFSAEVAFPLAGAYTVEVVAKSAKGPEVAAIFRVQAGAGGPKAAAPEIEPERADLAKAEAQVLSAINARRKTAGLPPLARSSLLDSVAAEHSAEMARLDYFAHVSPVSGNVVQRATRAGFRYERITENLGEAASALEAHRVIESSPGHLANVLDPDVDLVGLGTARVKRGTMENVLLTEIYARAQP